MRAILQFFLIILFVGITAAFSALNDAVISINYFIGQGDIRLTWLLLGCFSVGGLMSLILISGSYFKLRMQIRRLKKKATINDQEISNLRSLPVKDPY